MHLFTHSFICVPIYSLTRSSTYPFIYSLVHPGTYLFTHSFIHVPSHLLTRSFMYLVIYSLVHPYTYLFTHSFIHMPIHLLTRSSMYLFIYSFVHSCNYLFTHSLIHIPIYLLTRSSMYLFIYSLVHPCTYLFTHSFIHIYLVIYASPLAPMRSSSIPTLLQSGILIISPTERSFARGLHITSAQSVGNRKHRETDSPLGFSLPQPSSRALPAVTSSSVKVTSS